MSDITIPQLVFLLFTALIINQIFVRIKIQGIKQYYNSLHWSVRATANINDVRLTGFAGFMITLIINSSFVCTVAIPFVILYKIIF